MEELPRRRRLSCRCRLPLLQRPASCPARRGRGAADGADRRDLLQGRTDRRSSPRRRQSQAYDALRAHAVQPPPLRRLDDRAHPRRRAADRTGDVGAVRADPGIPPHPEQGYLACVGIVRLSGHYGDQRLEAAAERALEIGARTYGSSNPSSTTILIGAPPQRGPRTRRRSSIPTSVGRATTIRRDALLKHPTLDQLHRARPPRMAGRRQARRPHRKRRGRSSRPSRMARTSRRSRGLVAAGRAGQQHGCGSQVAPAGMRRGCRLRTTRDLDRALFQKLVEGGWIDAHDNLALIGPTGVGKSWLASALGHKACRDNRSVLYRRVPRLFEELALARGDGRHARLVRSLGRADLLILDDCRLQPLDAAARHDLLEILEERYGRRSTVITSQLPVDRWHGRHRRPDLRRRHPGPARPRRSPDRTLRR